MIKYVYSNIVCTCLYTREHVCVQVCVCSKVVLQERLQKLEAFHVYLRYANVLDMDIVGNKHSSKYV